MTKVNKEKMEEWAVALESGNYEQGKYDLLLDGKYCCIGVLGEINGVEVVNQSMESAAYDISEEISGKEPEYWWEMNDDFNMSFKEIANVIRKEFL